MRRRIDFSAAVDLDSLSRILLDVEMLIFNGDTVELEFSLGLLDMK